ncbi:MAG: molybdate ABC transporter substrate-binding protein [Gammaproteobacteria bacterium]|nr:molybdate ABC transporter substrate-binding protein [Gammaproteobacteria bacterium]
MVTLPCHLVADNIKVATASNFTAPLKMIAQDFERQSGHKVIIISGSTGKLYAQIRQGAPFDVFFSGDTRRAKLLENQIIENSRFTYAIGKLVLWTPELNPVQEPLTILHNKEFRHLAIANPKLAPYGKAAFDYLQSQNLWQALQEKLVRGENIGQTFHFVKSGSAQFGLVAYSQIKNPKQTSIEGTHWKIPETLYTPITQQAVMLSDKHSVKQFYDFIKSNESQEIIKSFGYSTSSKNLTEEKTYAQ